MKRFELKSKLLFIVFFIMISACAKNKSNFVVNSPDGKVTVEIKNHDGAITYTLFKDGKTLVNTSKISILPNVKSKIKNVSTNTKEETWKPAWGQFSEIKDHHNELVLNIKLKKVKAKLYVRVFSQGVGFRYKVEGYKEGTEADFYCEYNLSSSDLFYSPNKENEPLGPLSMDHLLTAKKERKLVMPIVVEQSQTSHLSLLESDLYSAPEFGVINFNINKETERLESSNKVKLSGKSVSTPWRVILINENIGDLVTNTVPLNLATPSQIDDTSWIQPGKMLWDWRVHGYKTADGFTYGINTESYIRFIDFAAEKGIEYFLIDDHWFTKVTPGHFQITPKLDLKRVSAYAKKKGVKLMLYYDRKKGLFGDDNLYSYFESLGMSGIKYGFMGAKVSFTSDAIQQSSENHLLVNFHDNPVPFAGIERTLPNAITREYCHAQQDARKAFTPKTFIKMALINAIQGPLDMNNGNFDLEGINSGLRKKGPRRPNTYFSTVVSEVARSLIIYSGVICLPDAPEAYGRKADLFEFIQKLPIGKWDESKVLDSKMSTYISTARRYGEEWFIGSVTNTEARTLDIKIDFLKEDTIYLVTYYEDAKETHGMKNPEAYQIRTEKIKKGAIVKAKMAPGGGHCMWIRPE